MAFVFDDGKPDAGADGFVFDDGKPDRSKRAAELKVNPSGMDYLRTLGTGLLDIPVTVGEGMRLAGADELGASTRDYWQALQNKIQSGMTPAGQEASSGEHLSERPWSTIGLSATRSAPGMAAMFLPGLGVSRALEAVTAVPKVVGGIASMVPRAGLTNLIKGIGVAAPRAERIAAALPTALGMGASEGVYSGLQNAAQSEQEMAQVPDEKLLTVPAFQQIYAHTDPSLPTAERMATARNEASKRMAKDITLRTALTTGGIGALTGGGVLGQIARPTSGFVKGAVKGFGTEAFQESTQSPVEQVWQNVGAQQYYDPTRPTTQGAAKQAIIGGAAGGVLGLLGGGVHGAMTPPAPQADPVQNAIENVAKTIIDPKKRDAATVLSAAVDSVTRPQPAAQPLAQPAQQAALTPEQYSSLREVVAGNPVSSEESAQLQDMGLVKATPTGFMVLPAGKRAMAAPAPEIPGVGQEMESRVAEEKTKTEETAALLHQKLAKEAVTKQIAETPEQPGSVIQEAFKAAAGVSEATTEATPKLTRAQRRAALQRPVDAAAHEAASSPTNELPEPTGPQIDAGNYKKGHVAVSGMDVSIENPEGSTRSDKENVPPKWSSTMTDAHYGYVKGVAARSPDKEHTDVFLKPGTPEDYAGEVYVIDQNKGNGHFDESKTMVGYPSEEAARAAYLANYEKGWEKRIRQITPMPMAEYKAKLQDPQAFLGPQARQNAPESTRPAATTKPATFATMQRGQAVTLFRGESAENEAGGQWWTTSRHKAERFGRVTEVILPAEEIGKHAAQGHGGPDEFVFPSQRPPALAAKLKQAQKPAASAEENINDAWKQTARGRDILRADVAVENAKDGAVVKAMQAAPSYPKLLAAYHSFQRSLKGKAYDPTIIEKHPWQMLLSSSGVMNAKSARAMTLATLENAVFKESGLPRKKGDTTFRGGKGVDWDRVTPDKFTAHEASERTVITPSEDAVIGQNAAGEQLHERPDGSIYRMHAGRPDFGGDLAPAEKTGAKPVETFAGRYGKGMTEPAARQQLAGIAKERPELDWRVEPSKDLQYPFVLNGYKNPEARSGKPVAESVAPVTSEPGEAAVARGQAAAAPETPTRKLPAQRREEAAQVRIAAIDAELAKLQAQYESKSAGGSRSGMVPPSVKASALKSITDKMDKLDAEKKALAGPRREEAKAKEAKPAPVFESLGDGTYVAKVGGKEVGRANVADDGKADYLTSITVEPEYRRTGIATGLWKHIERNTGKKLRGSPTYETPSGRALRESIGRPLTTTAAKAEVTPAQESAERAGLVVLKPDEFAKFAPWVGNRLKEAEAKGEKEILTLGTSRDYTIYGKGYRTSFDGDGTNNGKVLGETSGDPVRLSSRNEGEIIAMTSAAKKEIDERRSELEAKHAEDAAREKALLDEVMITSEARNRYFEAIAAVDLPKGEKKTVTVKDRNGKPMDLTGTDYDGLMITKTDNKNEPYNVNDTKSGLRIVQATSLSHAKDFIRGVIHANLPRADVTKLSHEELARWSEVAKTHMSGGEAPRYFTGKKPSIPSYGKNSEIRTRLIDEAAKKGIQLDASVENAIAKIDGGYKVSATAEALQYAYKKNENGKIISVDAVEALRNMANSTDKQDAAYAQRAAEILNAMGQTAPKPEAKEGPKFARNVDFTKTPEFRRYWTWDWLNDRPGTEASKAVDANGDPLHLYHGTQRPDRIGNRFRKSRATSGPMAFFTDSPAMASSYAAGKQDTSLEAPEDYAGWFKYKPEGSRSTVTIDQAWHHLSPEERQRIADTLPHVSNQTTEGDEYDGYRLAGSEEYGLAGKGHWDYETKQAKGNVLKAAKEIWLAGGTLFGREVEFMQVLKLGGMDTSRVEFDDPNAAYSAVYQVYLSITNPLVTNAIPPSVFDTLSKRAARMRGKPEQYGADMWDKRTRDPKEWVAELKKDLDANKNSYVWSSIPDWVTDTLKSLGYDGIQDTGGKSGGKGHGVWIPFFEEQVKSATANKGKYDPNKSNITFAKGATGQGITEQTLRSEIAKAFGPQSEALVGDLLIPLAKQSDIAEQLPHVAEYMAEGDKILGFHDPKTGKSYVVLENMTMDGVRGMVLHELGVHAGLEEMLGAEKYARILKQMDAMRRTGNKAVIEAHAQAVKESASPAQVQQETIAYLVTNHPDLPFVRRLIADIKAFLFRKFGILGDRLNPDDIAALAKASVLRAGVTLKKGEPLFSRAQDQTQTPEFKRWFGNSKVVDAEGKPLVVYHGSGAKDITVFDPTKAGEIQTADWGKGIYFTPSKWQANSYREEAAVRMDQESTKRWGEYEAAAKRLGTTPMMAGIDLGISSRGYAELSKFEQRWRDSRTSARDNKELGGVYPVYLKIENPLYYKYEGLTDPFLGQQAKAKGHDGIIIERDDGSIDEIVAFRPEQIKSATGNRGTFGSPPKSYDGASDTFSFEHLNDGLLADAGFVRNFAETRTFKKFGLRGFDVPSRNVVRDAVIGVVKDRKVLDSIIKFAPQSMVDILSRQQLTPEILFHDVPMLSDLFSIDGNNSVPFAVDESAKLTDGITRIVAEHVATALDLGTVPLDGTATRLAGTNNARAPGGGVAGARTKDSAARRNVGVEARSGSSASETRDGLHGVTRKEYAIAYDAETGLSTIETFDPNNQDIRFARNVAPAIAGTNTTGDYRDGYARQATDFLRDYFKSFDRLSLWQKTIGTPFHLALTNAEYKPFYDESQAFINDVSKYGNESADFAQDLLPRIEAGKDLWKKAASKADVQSAKDALYEGTLWGGGSPLEGRIWTDEELKTGRARTGDVSLPAFAPMTDKQIGLYRQALAATANSMDNLAKSLIHRASRAFSIGFDREMSLEDVAATVRNQIEDKVTDLTAELEQITDEKYIDDMAGNAYDAAGGDKAGEREAAAEKMRLKRQADAIRTQIDALDGRIDEKGKVVERGLKQVVDDIEGKAVGLKEHGYIPAMRFGRYAVYVTSQDGKQLYFGLYENRIKATLAKRALAQEFKGSNISTGVMPKEKYRLFQGLSLDALETFSEYITDEQGNSLAKDALTQAFLKAAVSERSVMKRHIHRKGIAGFSEDIPRVLASFVVSSARATSSNYHTAEMLRIAQGIESGEVSDYATKTARYLLDPVEEAQHLRGFLFAQYLGGSIASGLVNMTQPFMVTAPWLSQHSSFSDAWKKLSAAAVEDTNKLTGDIKTAFEQAKKEGIVSPQEIHQLRAETGGGITGRSLTLRKLSFAWGSIFSLAEQLNRKTTFLAAYRTAKEKGIADPYAFAVKAVAETQFVYNKANRMAWGRGPIGATLMTFKTFIISYIEMAKRLYHTDKRAFAMLALTLLVASGLEGIPFAEDFEDMIDTIGQWLGYATNSKKRLRQLVTDTLGKDIGEFALRGVSGLPFMPVDISNRLGMANLIPGTSMLKPSETNKARDVMELAGPIGQFIPTENTTLGRAIDRLLNADLLGVVKSGVASRAVANLAQGAEMLSTGQYKDIRGRRVRDVSAGAAMFKAAGLQPVDVARQQEREGNLRQDIGLHNRRESEIVEKWARAIVNHEPAQIRAAVQDMRQWNRDNPELRIQIKQSQIRARVRALRSTREERTLKSTPPEMRARVRGELLQQ